MVFSWHLCHLRLPYCPHKQSPLGPRAFHSCLSVLLGSFRYTSVKYLDFLHLSWSRSSYLISHISLSILVRWHSIVRMNFKSEMVYISTDPTISLSLDSHFSHSQSIDEHHQTTNSSTTNSLCFSLTTSDSPLQR